MIKIGLVGLPNAGKSTLFNYLTKLDTLVAEYPFSTIDPSKSILSLSLEESILLANNVGIRTIKCSDMELWDIAGLVEDASKGQGLGNEFLGHIKSCDVLLNVVYAGSSTTKSDIDHDILTVRREIALFDHNNLLKHFERARRQKNMYPNRQDVASYSEIISRLYYGTKNGESAINLLSEVEALLVTELELVSLKPIITILNTNNVSNPRISNYPNSDFAINVLDMQSIDDFSDEDLLLLEYNGDAGEAFKSALLTKVLGCSNSKIFYTVGHLGVGQWIVPKLSNSVICANAIHAELGEQLKVVRVCQISSFDKYDNWKDITSNGLSKTYSPSYIPNPLDVLLFN